MSGATPAIPDRLHELLADRALAGLEPDESQEFDALLAERPDADDGSYDASAAALAVALARGDLEPMPQAVLDRVHGALRLTMSGAATVGSSSERASDRSPSLVLTPPAAASASSGSAWSIVRAAPWLLAAASLLLAVLAWWPGGAGAGVDGLAELVQAIEADPAAYRLDWSSPVDLDVRGGVVWSETRQAGFMRFRGLSANDSTQLQYQLWIFDKSRARFQAVDGGVFDVDAGAQEVIVPIDAKLEVFEPTLFAVTTEPPGGVVVHDPELDPERFRIILTAPVAD